MEIVLFKLQLKRVEILKLVLMLVPLTSTEFLLVVFLFVATLSFFCVRLKKHVILHHEFNHEFVITYFVIISIGLFIVWEF